MQKLFQQFNTLKVLIIGDVMIDAYLWGNVDRISPEAPVPVVSVRKKENRLGGASNVALNIQALGAEPHICGIIGADKDGDIFLDLLKEQHLSDLGILKIKNRPTTVKTRVIAHNQQIVRIDDETDNELNKQDSDLLFAKICEIIENKKIDAIVFEDYDKGSITDYLIEKVISLAKEKNIITVADPKKRNFLSYKGITLFKPNLKELKEGLKIDLNPITLEVLEQAVKQLQTHINAAMVMVTLSEKGVYMESNQGKKIIPAHIRDIADVSGAGDTVIATAVVCLASGLDEFTTAAISNLAGGLVCQHVGVVPINKQELLKEIELL